MTPLKFFIYHMLVFAMLLAFVNWDITFTFLATLSCPDRIAILLLYFCTFLFSADCPLIKWKNND